MLMERLVDLARRRGAQIPFSSTTAYVNTIPTKQEAHCPGNLEYEERLRSWMRWNAMAMVVKANRADGDLGGHLSSFASLANMLGIGFNIISHIIIVHLGDAERQFEREHNDREQS